jgi:hypothetical protein
VQGSRYKVQRVKEVKEVETVQRVKEVEPIELLELHSNIVRESYGRGTNIALSAPHCLYR